MGFPVLIGRLNQVCPKARFSSLTGIDGICQIASFPVTPTGWLDKRPVDLIAQLLVR